MLVIHVPMSDAEKMCDGKDWFQLVEDLKPFPYWFKDDFYSESAIYVMPDGSQIQSDDNGHSPLPYAWSDKQLKAKGYELSQSTQAIIDWANSYNK